MDSQADSGNRKRDRPAPTRHLVIVGGGTMGRGIAESALLAGLKVTLLDQSAEALQQASTWICAQPGVASHRSQLECLPMADLSRLSGVDVAIETVAENPELKQQVFAELEQHLASDALIATNTSSITLKRLLADVQRPERCCGLHFCYPVRSRRLVEVIRGGQTSAATVETATGFVTTLSKHPLVVDDSPGFVVNRLYVSYLNEALALLLDGIPLSEIEAAAVDFGMPSGPFEQMDLMGIDVAVRAGTHQFFAFPDRVVPSALLVKVMKSGDSERNPAADSISGPQSASAGLLTLGTTIDRRQDDAAATTFSRETAVTPVSPHGARIATPAATAANADRQRD
jgi:3-hydroxyacyl-CoA dehydrogenase